MNRLCAKPAQVEDEPMADHKHEHGSMNIKTQEKTFEGFIRWVTWGAAISIGILIFLALANS
jgi:hypothetical protein